jgi:hypothetical protein
LSKQALKILLTGGVLLDQQVDAFASEMIKQTKRAHTEVYSLKNAPSRCHSKVCPVLHLQGSDSQQARQVTRHM